MVKEGRPNIEIVDTTKSKHHGLFAHYDALLSFIECVNHSQTNHRYNNKLHQLTFQNRYGNLLS